MHFLKPHWTTFLNYCVNWLYSKKTKSNAIAFWIFDNEMFCCPFYSFSFKLMQNRFLNTHRQSIFPFMRLSWKLMNKLWFQIRIIMAIIWFDNVHKLFFVICFLLIRNHILLSTPDKRFNKVRSEIEHSFFCICFMTPYIACTIRIYV